MKSSSHLLALSFDTSAAPGMELKPVVSASGESAGWGLACYPKNDPAAIVIKDPRSIRAASMSEALGEWGRLKSSTFVCHVRGAAKRRTQQDTHPFTRSYAGRDFVFAQVGDLDINRLRALPQPESPTFEPIGRTDSEFAFCWIMNRLRQSGARTLAEAGWEQLRGWFCELAMLGPANFVLADGRDLVTFRDPSGALEHFWIRITPPHPQPFIESAALRVDLSNSRTANKTLLAFSSVAMTGATWTALEPGQMIAVRKASVRWNSHPHAVAQDAHLAPPRPVAREMALQDNAVSISASPAFVPVGVQNDGSRILHVVHDTYYTYQQPVESSSHIFRLRPVHDRYQEVLRYSLSISIDGRSRDYEDVFGNQSLQWDSDQPYSELRLISESVVRMHPPRGMVPEGKRWRVPPVWLPWQREMMAPYTLPPELPPTQLRELSDFAMSFVERQDHDLVETLTDINTTLHRDFRYVTGSTTLATTPYEVYVHRQGVCQDFANLLICLARLLNVPARYRVGYLHLGTDYQNVQQAEASHAWAEVFLPVVGWVGLDPTNGRLADTDHVRVAAGRNYRDATPTSGTLFSGGAGEVLTVLVRVEDWTGRPVQ